MITRAEAIREKLTRIMSPDEASECSLICGRDEAGRCGWFLFRPNGTLTYLGQNWAQAIGWIYTKAEQANWRP